MSLYCRARYSNVNSPGFCTRSRNIHSWGRASHLPLLRGDAESWQNLPGWHEMRKTLHLLVLSCLRAVGCPALPSLPKRLSPHLGSQSLQLQGRCTTVKSHWEKLRNGQGQGDLCGRKSRGPVCPAEPKVSSGSHLTQGWKCSGAAWQVPRTGNSKKNHIFWVFTPQERSFF